MFGSSEPSWDKRYLDNHKKCIITNYVKYLEGEIFGRKNAGGPNPVWVEQGRLLWGSNIWDDRDTQGEAKKGREVKAGWVEGEPARPGKGLCKTPAEGAGHGGHSCPLSSSWSLWPSIMDQSMWNKSFWESRSIFFVRKNKVLFLNGEGNKNEPKIYERYPGDSRTVWPSRQSVASENDAK